MFVLLCRFVFKSRPFFLSCRGEKGEAYYFTSAVGEGGPLEGAEGERGRWEGEGRLYRGCFWVVGMGCDPDKVYPAGWP